MRFFAKDKREKPGSGTLRFPSGRDADTADIITGMRWLKISVGFNILLALALAASAGYVMLRGKTYHSATNEMRIERMAPERVTPHDPAALAASVVLDAKEEKHEPVREKEEK